MRHAFWWFVAWCVFLLAGCLGPRMIIEQHAIERIVEIHDLDPRLALTAAYDATVLISLEYGEPAARAESCGSGALIAPNRVLTAAHVVMHGTEHDRSITLTFPDGKVFLGHVVRADRDRDVALVEFAGHAMVEPLVLASDAPASLSVVWNFGAPDCVPGYMSEARWLGKNEDGRIVSGGLVWPGMSGGPVVDASGNLVGVTRAVDTDENDTIIPQMGFAVDWKDVKAFLQ